jgi:hypothetical protein
VKALVFNGEINDDNTAKFLEALNDLGPDETAIIYLCSHGGDAANAEIIEDYVSKLGPERFTFVVTWNCSSIALGLLCRISCPFEIGPNAIAILHLYSHELDIRELSDKYSQSTFFNNYVNRDNEAFMREVQIGGIEGEELDEIAKGHDIIISGSRITEYIERIRRYRAKGGPR